MSRKQGQPVHGWVNLDKPVGVSSAKAVAIVRRVFNAAKAGHGGTLDPLASGVLPIALGEATKTVAFAMGSHKSYEFTLAWGVETSTDDGEGSVTKRSAIRPSEAEVNAILPQFTGHIEQVPPAYSAIKVDGQRAYKLARKADADDDAPAVQLAARPIYIETCTLLSHNETEARFYVACGKGAYIRSMARDIGRALGSAAHVTSLRRMSVGSFHADQAISLDFLENLEHSAPAFEHLHPVVSALDDIPALPISGDEASLLRHGQTLGALSPSAQMRFAGLAEGQTGIAICGDVPIALVAIKAGAVCPVRVLNL
ncbi:tRNA pseudouridine(55) synthase TruB [Candidatus Puniceispirillum sp.]|jgi:tRNA pseudouridine55 synthase|uniref:tRNA pseudouridine(55) synthase TruB n=1 Tax=Candidatus Puniceispirillum sp. TaxID=2026719 RepID=UPI001EBCE077|nr:tRNA pseudouridine(55) synthase TruB [Candidatus Puniceispirillum sp.]MBT6565295.1 tRNA pseudouridine(55) synthase TruB [Candidatus Puniceispirillum sp.]